MIRTRWLAGRRALARRTMRRSSPGVAVELGVVQPIVATIDDNGDRSVGVYAECGSVYCELRVADPEAFRAELDAAIRWRNGGLS